MTVASGGGRGGGGGGGRECASCGFPVVLPVVFFPAGLMNTLTFDISRLCPELPRNVFNQMK